MHQLKLIKLDQLLLEVSQRQAFESIRLTVQGTHKVHEGKLCAFHEGKLIRALTVAEVILLAAHDVIASPLCILAGNSDQARYLMRELRIHPKKAVLLSHPSALRRLGGVDYLIVIKYGTYLERRDFGDIARELERRGAAFLFAWDEMLSELGDLREYLDAKLKSDRSNGDV